MSLLLEGDMNITLMDNLKNFAYAFTHLHTHTKNRHKAPHKAILLLSIIDLIETKVICSPQIELTDELVRKFNINWKRYIGNSTLFKCNIETPYYHMQYEPFWNLAEKIDIKSSLAAEGTQWYKGTSFKKELPKGGYSLKALRSAFEYAKIDEKLFELLQNADARALLRVLLISTYFTKQPTRTMPDFSKLVLTLSIIIFAA